MIKCWFKSFCITLITMGITWIVIENENSDIVILTIFLGAILSELISLLIALKIKEKIYKKIILCILLPSNYYLLFILTFFYFLFFTEWSFQLGF